MGQKGLLAFMEMDVYKEGYEHNRNGWRDSAACKGTDPNLFFDRYEADRDVQLFVDDLCESCPVQTECDAYAEENGLEGGVFARKYRYQSVKMRSQNSKKSKNRIRID